MYANRCYYFDSKSRCWSVYAVTSKVPSAPGNVFTEILEINYLIICILSHVLTLDLKHGKVFFFIRTKWIVWVFINLMYCSRIAEVEKCNRVNWGVMSYWLMIWSTWKWLFLLRPRRLDKIHIKIKGVTHRFRRSYVYKTVTV